MKHFRKAFLCFSLIWLGLTILFPGWCPAASQNDQGLDSILGAFSTYAETARKDWNIPGMAVAIVAQDRVVYSQGFGVRKLGANDPVDHHTLFQIGSTSKAFTCTLVAMTVDQGKFTWTDLVQDHWPEFEMFDPWVTREFQVMDLMAQHSGLASYSGDLLAMVGFDRAHIIRSLRHIEPAYSFRSTFSYVNNLFVAAAALVEQFSGRTWEEDLQTRIFAPLGMTETGTGLDHYFANPNHAVPHAQFNEVLTPLEKDWPFSSWVYTYGPAGGINSTVLDMAQWIRFQLNHGKVGDQQILSAENLKFTHSPITPITSGGPIILGQRPLAGGPAFYAQGWIWVAQPEEPIVWHNGGTSGCKTVVAMLPKSKVGLVVLSNNAETVVPEILAQWFFDRILGLPETDWSRVVMDLEEKQEAQAPPTENVPAKAVRPAGPPEAYLGSYHSRLLGAAEVVKDGRGLGLVIGPHRLKVKLAHLDGDLFELDFPQYPDLNLSVHFLLDEMGQARSMILAEFQPAERAVFHRVEGQTKP